MSTLSQNIYPHVYQYMNNSVLSMDILPLLVDIIIQPNMRPVSIQQHITIIDKGGGILNTHVSTSSFSFSLIAVIFTAACVHKHI